MPQIQSLTADPASIEQGGSTSIRFVVTGDADEVRTIRGEVVGTAQVAEVVVTLKAPAVRYSTDPATAQPGDALLTAPDGGTLTPVPGFPGEYIYTA